MSDETKIITIQDLINEMRDESEENLLEFEKYSVDSPPGSIEERVFIGGNYVLMPILREMSGIVINMGFQPILAYNFDIPRELTLDYTMRLLSACRYVIFEMTLGNGHLVEYVRANTLTDTKLLQVYMAINEEKNPPKTMSVMLWQTKPPPQGYCTILELEDIILSFLSA